MKPIIFNSEMIRAILDGRKTQTRRVIKPQPPQNSTIINYGTHIVFSDGSKIRCPYGAGKHAKGNHLWVRETFFYEWPDDLPPEDMKECRIVYKASEPYYIDSDMYDDYGKRYRWSPSIHMPKWASRITLDIKDVRVERVQDITDLDALKEGILSLGRDRMLQDFPDYAQKKSEWIEKESQRKRRLFESRIKPPLAPSPYARFGKWWDSINAKKGYGWGTNPWVWVIEFEKLD